MVNLRTLSIAVLIFFGFGVMEAKHAVPVHATLFEDEIGRNESLTTEERAVVFYEELEAGEFSMPSQACFELAFKGYQKLKEAREIKRDILTIVDFSLSSTQRRLWVIDMHAQKVLLQTVVSHGRNSGLEFATKFSNQVNSYMSSIGFYKTGETYFGKHGFSLRLDGLEKGINDLARPRAIVMHGADYASEELAQRQGRLGRSLGCPAVPQEVKQELIELIKEKTCLFIYYPNQEYLSSSAYI